MEIDHVFGGAEAGVRFRLSQRGGPFEPVAVPAGYYAGADPADVFDFYGKAEVGARLFTRCVATGRREGPDFADGVRVQQVVDAALLSQAEDRRVALPAVPRP